MAPAKRRVLTTIVAGLVSGIAALSALPADASPSPQTFYQLPSNSQCTKGIGNCVVYPKAASLPSGRLVAAFEKATIGPTGSAYDQSIPIYKSDDNNTTWQQLATVRAPAFMGGPARYTSNWTNPYLYVMPQTVGSLTTGTLLLASVVSGEDEYFREHKAADPSWQPSNDGDRRDMAIALYKSTDNGASWSFVNIIATGGWQGGSAGAIGTNIANANSSRQVDPVWEPYLMVHNNELIAYYSDENDYTGYNGNGSLNLRGDNNTATDSHGQVVAHREWDGNTATPWSVPYVDVTGSTQSVAGVNQIGGGRPGMPNVVPTTNGQWLLTYEYFGGGQNVKQKIFADPLNFRATGGAGGTDIGALAVTGGSPSLATGGSPVVIRLPDGRLVYNAAGSGDVWVNSSGSSTGAWTRQATPVGAGYSRNLTWHQPSGRVVILSAGWPNGGIITQVDISPGGTAGAYYERITNRTSGRVVDVFGQSTADGGDVQQWAWNGGYNQQWEFQDAGSGYFRIVNRNSGKCLDVYTASAADGADVVQWTCSNGTNQQWQVITAGGFAELRARHSGKCLDVNAHSTVDGANIQQWTCTGASNQQWTFAAA
ncbi:RICIN domain-containing protein [Actinoplanes sp. NPDC026670]|uniref:RICIN domain-containing protein n=1 Tax=Actinoplanes sp. NPDC026670 TaxID=3154700 RepID=UPI0033E57A58